MTGHGRAAGPYLRARTGVTAMTTHENDHDEDDTRGAGWLGVWKAIGVALGSALEIIPENLALGVAIGPGLGVAFGEEMMTARQ